MLYGSRPACPAEAPNHALMLPHARWNSRANAAHSLCGSAWCSTRLPTHTPATAGYPNVGGAPCMMRPLSDPPSNWTRRLTPAPAYPCLRTCPLLALPCLLGPPCRAFLCPHAVCCLQTIQPCPTGPSTADLPSHPCPLLCPLPVDPCHLSSCTLPSTSLRCLVTTSGPAVAAS